MQNQTWSANSSHKNLRKWARKSFKLSL